MAILDFATLLESNPIEFEGFTSGIAISYHGRKKICRYTPAYHE